ncbi:BREX system P-loop protein BrxC [Candidatus Bipolaricaulota bacterium]|nr:BREX system P-loop protein BrxC [Candidatus Bipolaricaulota bacterium]
MKIREVFRHPIERRIEEVIKVDLGDEETVAHELAEYVVTDHLRREFEKVLDVFQETIRNPNEAVTVWISGFFGSGKSSFAKVLGYILENSVIQGRTATDRFLERAHDDRLRALLATIHAQAPSLSVFVDLSTARYVLREGESIVLPLYRALLDRLGYSKDILLAELEYNLEGDGDLGRFAELFEQVTGRPWTERRHVALARNEASHALHLLRPETYPQPDSWIRGAHEPVVTADWFADRALALLQRRGGGKERIVFIVDEVGQYVARSEKRMYDLMGLAHAIQKKRGKIWLVVTSQEKLEDVVDSLEGRRIELARVRDRFPVTVDLVPSDIEEVVARRVLEKTTEGANAIREIFRQYRNRLKENTRLDSPTRQRDFSEEEFIRLYPLLPYQIQLFIDAVSAHRARGGGSPMLGGSNRTLIKLAQQLIIHPKTALGEKEVGSLVTTAMAYDLLEGITPTAWQAEIQQVESRHGPEGMPTQVAKTISLLSGVRALKLEAQNIAALLHLSIQAENCRPKVEEALHILVEEEVVRHSENGYRLQLPEEKDWERERRGIEMKPATWHRIRRELIKQMFEGLAVESRRTFRVGIVVNGDRLIEGDIEVVIQEVDEDTFEDIRKSSREKLHTLYWAYRPQDQTLELARELHRSREMIQRHEGNRGSKTELELLGEERVRKDRIEKQLRAQLEGDLLRGIFIFEGVEEQPQGEDVRDALKECFGRKIDRIYPRLHEFAVPARREDARAILQSETLEGLPTYLGPGELGVLRPTPDGMMIATDVEPLRTVLAEIRDRTNYGMEATGKYLEEKFGQPPFGAHVEVLMVFLALLLRAGTIEVITKGARITNPRDPRLDKVFGTLPGFRSAAFAPQREVDPDMRARVAKKLQRLTGEREPIATDELARRIRQAFRSHSDIITKVTASLRALDLPIPEDIERVGKFIEMCGNMTDEEVIKTCDETWEDLRAGLESAKKWHENLTSETLELLRDAKRVVQRGPVGLGPEEEERLSRLKDLLHSTDLVTNLGTIHRLVREQQETYRAAWEDIVRRLRREVGAHIERLRQRFASGVEKATLEEALKPLHGLIPSGSATPEVGPSLEDLRGRLARVSAMAAEIDRHLTTITTRAEVVRVRFRDLYDGVVTSEEDLQVLLERLRQTILEALAQGKQVILE